MRSPRDFDAHRGRAAPTLLEEVDGKEGAMGDPVVHFEIRGRDPAKLREFYSAAFGWGIEEVPGGYQMVDTQSGGVGIGGGMSGPEPGVYVYVQVDDPAAHLAKVQGLGARVVTEVTVVPGMVTYAEFADPEGNIVGIVATETPPAE
jgi:predicted enzyme related to lactoylglutathione lyase